MGVFSSANAHREAGRTRLPARLLACLAAAMALALAGCTTSGFTTAPTTGNGSLGTTTNVTVAVTPATTGVDVGQSVTLTASVLGDSSNRGVTWTVTSGTGTVSTSSGLTTNFVAPASGTVAMVRAASVLDPTRTATATINVSPAPGFTSSGQLAQGFANVGYSVTLPVAGGTGAKRFTVTAGALPAGLVLDVNTGTVSGIPSAAGTSTFTVAVTDSASPAQTTSGSFTIGVSALILNAPALASGVVGVAYPATNYSANYAQGGVGYSVSAGTLPPGLGINGSTLAGTPTTAGTFNFTITATDAVGQTASAAQSIAIAPALALPGGALPAAQTGTTYTGASVAATGGTAPYTYAVAAGSVLPGGITLGTDGTLGGTPAAAGSYSFGITATDSGSNGAAQTATGTYTLTVTPGPLSISTASLPGGVNGSPYSIALTSVGGVPPYSYSLQSGTLPAGITLSPTGTLLGSPTANGSSSFTVQVADSQSTPATATHAYTLTVTATVQQGTQNALLNGSYAFLTTGLTNGVLSPSAANSGNAYGSDAIGYLHFDGVTGVSGSIETNDAANGYTGPASVTGSYSVGDDHRGLIVMQANGATTTMTIAVSNISGGIASRFRIARADATDTNNALQVQSSGIANLQVPADFGSIGGNYVFGMAGETPCATCTILNGQFGAVSTAGYLALGGGGLITGGSQDSMTYNAAYPQIALSGFHNGPNANGRGGLEIMPVSTFVPAIPSAPVNYIFYAVSARQLLVMSIDPHTSTTMLAGPAYQQQQNLYSLASLNGSLLAAENAVSGGDGNTHLATTRTASLASVSISGNGFGTVFVDSNTAGTVASTASAPASLSYTVSDQGRLIFSAPGLTLPVFWLYDNNAAMGTELHAGAGLIGSSVLEARSGSPFSAASLSGLYGVGTRASLAPVKYMSGSLSAPGDGTATLTADSTANGVLTSGISTQLGASVSATGELNLSGTGAAFHGFMVSPSKFILFNSLAGFTQPVLYVGEQ